MRTGEDAMRGTGRARIAEVILWVFVLVSSIQLGGAVYEMLVVNPLWAGHPPQSVTGWNPVPAYAIEPARFWGRVGPLSGITPLLLLAAAGLLPRPRRRWALVAGLSALAVAASTVLFFVPILQETIFSRGAGLSPEEITRKVHLWVQWNWLRVAALGLAWAAGVRALSVVPSSRTS